LKVYNSIDSLIGNTPLLSLSRFCEARNIPARILAKLEYLNPTGSIKDRAALGMILDAEERGHLREGSVIIEPTSGNTGIGLAAIAAVRGYRVILTMPDTMSEERRRLLSAYGAELVLTPGAEGMDGAIKKAEELAEALPGSFIPNQFENPANAAMHEKTTAEEILRDTDGKVDIVVAGIGSGGTISGIGRILHERLPNVRVIGVEPADSPLISEGKAGSHKLQGIGANFVPKLLDRESFDEIMTVSTEDAYSATRDMARLEGAFVGITSGAAVYAAEMCARKPENAGKTIVAIAPDSGSRYLSTPKLFSE